MEGISMQDIACRAGCSKNTVSLALKNDPQISLQKRKEIQRIAQEMGYRQNAAVGELMAKIRKSKKAKFLSNIAAINCHHSRDSFSKHPTIPVYLEGIIRRANWLGYEVDKSLWMHEPGHSSESWKRVIKARNLRGLILVGLMKQNKIPDFFLPVIESLPVVVTGVRTKKPALSFSCVDHHMLSMKAVEQVLELGFERPAFVLDPVIDKLVEGRFSAGFQTAQKAMKKKNQLPVFYHINDTRKDINIFKDWLGKHTPDIVFTLYNETYDWLKKIGYKIPEEISIAQLEWRSSAPHWAGMNQHNENVGESAVDMLVSMIHHAEVGVPDYPKATLIGGSWVNGNTIGKGGSSSQER